MMAPVLSIRTRMINNYENTEEVFAMVKERNMLKPINIL